MPNSPAITVLERDQSQYAITESTTILAIVGYATKGPTNKPTLVSSVADFLDKFGPGPKDAPFSSMAMRRAFTQTNQILFTRVADTTAGFAERVIQTGDTGNSKVRFRSKETGSALNGSFIQVVEVTNPIGVNTYNLGFYYLRGGDSFLIENFEDVSFSSSEDNFFQTQINATELNGGSSWISAETHGSTTGVYTLGTTTSYILGAQGEGDTTADAYGTGDTWTAPIGDTTVYTYRSGTDGTPSIGGDTLFTQQLGTESDLSNFEALDYHIMLTPDNNSNPVIDKALQLANSRGDFLYLADPPSGLNSDESVEWHNGLGHGRATALNSSYGATYHSWLTDFNSETGEYLNTPPSIFVAQKMLENDRVEYPWIAVAGSNRGVIQAFDYEVSPSVGKRDNMYGGLNAVNPIVNFPSRGLIIWGQKTLLRQNSALNRINVRRMLIHIKKLMRRSLDPVLFEPHDPTSWVRATAIVRAILEPVRQRRGVTQFSVIFDRSTTSADDVRQGILRGRVRVVPTNTIEFINVGIELSPAGTVLSDS